MYKKKISKIKKMFADEYLRNGNNAGAAYWLLKPDVKYNSARSMGSQWLKLPEVNEYIQAKQMEFLAKGGADREWITAKIIRLIEECENDRDRRNLTKALDMFNKMLGNYTIKQEVTHKGLTINYLKPPKEEDTK